jgi:DNA-directed RNA polymerase subunit K/omega
MAYDRKKSKYIKGEKEKDAEETKQDEKKQEYRSSVITPKRARELAEEAQREAELAESESAEEASLKTAPEISQEKEAKSEDKKSDYRKSVITPKRARELAEEEMKKAQEPEEAALSDDTAEGIDEIIRRKGTSSDMFKGGENDTEKEILYDIQSAAVSTKSIRNRATFRRIICTAVIVLIAFALQLFNFTVPFVPKMFTVEFSILPELIATAAYGPLTGIVICVLKNLLHVAFFPTTAVSAATNLIVEATFLFISALLYSRSMLARDIKAYRKNGTPSKPFGFWRFLINTAIAAIISLIPQLIITRYISFPLLERFYSNQGFTMNGVLSAYQQAMSSLKAFVGSPLDKILPEIHTLTMGIAVYNLSVTFAKLAVTTLIAGIVLKFTLPFLVYRNKKAKNNYSLDTELETVKSE